MMHSGNCRCGHHWVVKIMGLLIWVAGVLFFWSGMKGAMVWGYDPLFYGWSVLVLAVMAHSCKYCGCCGMGKMKMEGDKVCSHESGCVCGDCGRCK